MSIFSAPLAALFNGPLGEDAYYRPRLGAAFNIRIAPASAGDRDQQVGVHGFVVPELVYEAHAAQFPVTPAERDTIRFGTEARFVKSVERVNDGEVYRFILGAAQ